ncbi:MAG TPA: PLDc N-terminal domain-containing protein [Chitinophagaceae bacterium]
MLNLRKPAFIFNVIGVLLFFIGLYLQQTGSYGAYTLMFIGLFMAVIYWFWAIIDVVRADDLNPNQKKFWLIIVIVVPALGGALFHIMHQSRNKIVT